MEQTARRPGRPLGGVGPRPGPTGSSVPEPLLSRPCAAPPSVAKGWGRAGITWTRSSHSCQRRSSGQPQRPATGGGSPLETAAGRVDKFPGCLGPNGRLFYLSHSAPTAAASAILGSHCGGRRGAGGLQRGPRAVGHAPSPRQRRAGARARLGCRRSAINARAWGHVTGGSLRRRLRRFSQPVLRKRTTGDYKTQNANFTLVIRAFASATRAMTTNPSMPCASGAASGARSPGQGGGSLIPGSCRERRGALLLP